MSAAPSGAGGIRSCRQGPQGAPEDRQPLVDLLDGDVDRRDEADHVVVVAAREDEEPLVGGSRDERLAQRRVRLTRRPLANELQVPLEFLVAISTPIS